MLPSSSSSSPSSHQNQTTSSFSSRRQPRRQLHHPQPALPPPPPARLSSITNIPEAQAPQPLPLLPKQALLPPPALSSNKTKTKQQIKQHSLLRCDITVLHLIQDHIASLEDHVAWSRVCRRMRRIYAGEEAGVKAFWSKALLVKEGWGLPSQPSPTPTSPFLTLLLHLTHRRTCSLEVLRPWKYGPPPKEERLVDPRGEWIRLCGSNGEEEGVWPPFATTLLTSPPSHHNHHHLQPNPFLSDFSLPLSPPPPSSSILEQITIIASDDASVPLSTHPSFLNQLATWPAREVVEVEFVWDREATREADARVDGEGKGNGRVAGKKGHSHRKKAVVVLEPAGAGSGAEGGTKTNEAWTGLSNGRVVVSIGKKGSGRLITVQALLEGMVDYWRAELVWEETRSLVKKFPGLDRRTSEQRLERGGWNKFLGQVRKDYGR